MNPVVLIGIAAAVALMANTPTFPNMTERAEERRKRERRTSRSWAGLPGLDKDVERRVRNLAERFIAGDVVEVPPELEPAWLDALASLAPDVDPGYTRPDGKRSRSTRSQRGFSM